MEDIEVMHLDAWKSEFTEDECNFDKVKEYLKFLQESVESRDPDRYSEWHHVMPKCIDKEGKYISQTVHVTCVAHFEAHVKLIDCFNGMLKSKMGYVISMMSGRVKGDLDPEKYEEALRLANQSRTAEYLDPKIRKSVSEKTSLRCRGKGNPMYGKRIPEESIRRGVEARKKTMAERKAQGIPVTSHRGYIIYNDGVHEYHIKGGDSTEGLVKGRLPCSEETRKKRSECFKNVWKDPIKRQQMLDAHQVVCQTEGYSKKLSEAQIKRYANMSEEERYEKLVKPRLSENLSLETRQKMSESQSKQNLGRVWINNGKDNLFVYPEDLKMYESQGYIVGRIIDNSWHKDSMFVTDGEHNRLIKPGDQIPEGWRKGVTRHASKECSS